MAKRSDLDVMDVPFEMAEIDDRVVPMELIDSFDSRLLSWKSEGRRLFAADDCDGFLGGSAGDELFDGVRGGSCGPEV